MKCISWYTWIYSRSIDGVKVLLKLNASEGSRQRDLNPWRVFAKPTEPRHLLKCGNERCPLLYYPASRIPMLNLVTLLSIPATSELFPATQFFHARLLLAAPPCCTTGPSYDGAGDSHLPYRRAAAVSCQLTRRCTGKQLQHVAPPQNRGRHRRRITQEKAKEK